MKNTKRAFINGKIFTSDRDNLFAEAMIIDGNIIEWIGNCDNMPEGNYEIIDIKGKCVLPGFIDAHMHPMLLAEFSKQISCLPPKVNSIEELICAIADVRKKQGPDQWIQGWGYDEGKFLEHRTPNRHDLDRGAADAPVYLIRSCEHIRCVNSKALEIAGITKDTPDPEGGRIDHDEHGEPTGILIENAKYLIMPFIHQETKEDAVADLVNLSTLLAAQGIVAVSDMGNLTSKADNYPLYVEAASKGFKQRVVVYYIWDYYENDHAFNIAEERRKESSQIRVGGLKLIGDGSVSGKTAWMDEPYLNTEDNYGMPVYTDESMNSALSFVKKNHCQLAVHAMGSRAIDRVLDRVCDEPRWMDGETPDIRLEHVTEPSEEALARIEQRGIAIVTQPIFAYCEIETYLKNIGGDRIKTEYPFKRIFDKGIMLGLSTDAPATSWAVPYDPFTNIKAALTKTAYEGTDLGQDQRLDVETAIISYTRTAAEIMGIKDSGCLKKGYHADFIVLSKDIFETEPTKVDTIRVERTFVDGECIYGS